MSAPLEPFRFCPLCATELVPPRRSGGGSYCPVHERSWYRNSSPSVGCALVRDGRALVTVRGREPEKGRYDVTGGFLEPGEHPVDGLKREAREELGVEIGEVRGPVMMATHRYGEEGDYVLALGFMASITEGDPAPADDAVDLEWASLDELDGLDFAWEHDRALVRAALEEVPQTEQERS
jgi:ADP-ribose pyrophosphatase YjhB (NUDIX family)